MNSRGMYREAGQLDREQGLTRVFDAREERMINMS